MRKRGLPPIADRRSRVLILGTLPGEESLRLGQYYGHPRNHFWPLMSRLLERDMPSDYAARCALLLDRGLAVWDVLKSAERAGSLDSGIRNPQPNAFASFFSAHPDITTIAFNGRKAHALFLAHVARRTDAPWTDLRHVLLPSTSPTFVRPLDEKSDAWIAALRGALSDAAR